MSHSRLALPRFVPKTPAYHLCRSNGVTDGTLLTTATEYRTNVSRRYQQLSLHELTTKFVNTDEVVASLKYDGEGVFVYYNSEDPAPKSFVFNAPSGRCRFGHAALAELENKLQAAGVKKALFVAESSLPGQGGKRATVADVIRVTSSGTEQEINSLQLAFYDIIMLDGVDYRNKPFLETWGKLHALFGNNNSDRVFRCEGTVLSETQVPAYFNAIASRAEEGIVVRRLQKLEVYKIKPALTIDAVIIGYVEGDFEGMYGVTSILLGLTGEGNVVREFLRVGSGFSDDQRVKLLGQLSPLKVASPIPKTDSSGRPITFIKPQIIVEIQGEALELENFSGRENRTPTYTFDGANYKFHGAHPLPRLTHATFSHIREDKELADGGARFSQVTDQETYARFNYRDAVPNATRVLRAQTFTKELKGTMTRKFYLVETSGVGSYPYITYFIDYSPSRAEAFKFDLGVHTSLDQANAAYAALLEENVKKGWSVDPKVPEINLSLAVVT